MTSSLWRLDATDTTVLLTASGESDVPAIAWFGDRLPSAPSQNSAGQNTADQNAADQNAADQNAVALISDLPLPMAKLDESVSLSLFPQRSSGIDCSPALRGHCNGTRFDHQFVRSSVAEKDGSLIIELNDDSAELSVSLNVSLHKITGVLSIGVTLINKSAACYTVDWLASATMPLPGSYRECLHLHGRWGLEFQTHRSVIAPGSLFLQSHRGRTSHERYPGVIVGKSGFSEQHGDVMAANLAWSGSHASNVELLSDGRVYYQSGVSLDPGELQLEAGDPFKAPVCFFKRHSSSGLNAVSQAMHEFLRSEVLPAWTRRERPVHANSWEALYFDHNIDSLKSLIDSAAEVGAERFILDDGWFPARRADNAGLGDWTVDETVYPEGLHPVVDHVRSHGMQFGLWFEPEMVNPDSELYRNYPEWVLHLKPYETPMARYQLVLDIDNPNVFDYLYTKISDLIRDYKIDYIKWDHNRDIILAGDGARSRMVLQTTACYRLMRKLTSAFNNLEIESCSSGGARADWGVLSYTGRVWTSDSIDAIDRVKIQRGYSYFNPPEVMGAHVGHAEAHLTGRNINIHTRAIVALQGQYGYEIDARKLSSEEKQILLNYVSLYKANRDWIASCTTWRLDSSVENLVCSGLVCDAQEKSWWFAVAEASLPQTIPGQLVLSGLRPEATYSVNLISHNKKQLEDYTKKMPAWLLQEQTVSGALLMTVGLSLPVMPAQSAVLIEVKIQ